MCIRDSERAVSFYAELVDINAYDQPGVEAGKKAAAEVIQFQKKVTEILSNGDELSIARITSLISNSSPEPIFFIIRQMCFSNEDYFIKGDWSKPSTILIKKIS